MAHAGIGIRGEWGVGKDEGAGGKFLSSVPFPMPNAQCPMPNAQCPMPNAQCPIPNSLNYVV
ncbi:histidine kinase [Nostoc sp.]|uniref:histidine kinase n=1 Tax=Nostoc sp. TaxID=1180 RepID=UPI002FFB12F9